MSIWDEPADFWIGAGLIAEVPLMLIEWMLPNDFCNAYLAQFIDCPTSAWLLSAVCLTSYIAVAWAGHTLGLGDAKK